MNTGFKLITALKIWLVIYPSITVFLFLLGGQLSSLPLYQRTFILTIILVPWIVFVGMPVTNYIIGIFSLKKAKDD